MFGHVIVGTVEEIARQGQAVAVQDGHDGLADFAVPALLLGPARPPDFLDVFIHVRELPPHVTAADPRTGRR